MVSVEQVLSAVIDFLDDAQKLGIIKDFTLTQCDVKDEEPSGADEIISKFLKKIEVPTASAESSHSSITEQVNEEQKGDENIIEFQSPEKTPAKNSSSDEEYVVIEDEKRSESEGASESPIEDEVPMNIDEVSADSSNYSIVEQVNEDEKKSDCTSESHHSEKNSPDKKLENVSVPENAFESSVKKNLVQINVDTNEMKRRIAAFISRKRKEVDEWNVQEFCGRSYIDEQDPAWEEIDSCARVDAVFVPRRGCKSHIKVSRVQNVFGPQTHWHPEAKKIKQEPGVNENQPSDASLQALDERLLNMETHLKLKSDGTLRKNLFKRIRNLEDRILYLESTSPEYFYASNSEFSAKEKLTDEKIQSNSVEEIQKRIDSLKHSLKMKALQARNKSLY